MALNPCIENGDCIDLSIQPNSNLRADLNLSEDAGNCADCRPNGLYVPCGVTLSPNACNGISDVGNGIWAPTASQTLAAAGPGPGSPYNDVNLVGPFFPGGKIVVRTVQLNWSTPACGGGVAVGAMNAGPVQFTDVSPGGRVVASQQSKSYQTPGPVPGYAGGPYVLIRNPSGNFMDIAWPQLDSTTNIDPVGAGLNFITEWEQSFEVFAGSVGSIVFRSVFLYVWVMFS